MRDQNDIKCNFSDTIDWLRLARSSHVGPHTFYKLLTRFGSARTALEALPEMAKRGGMNGKIKICTVAAAEQEMEAHTKIGAVLISRDDPRYPPRLVHVDDAPPLISVLGRIELLSKRAVGVIGARNASLNGQRFAEHISRELGQNGLMVISGLARGIDAAAHRGALSSGTLAALGGGVDVIYPRENKRIYEEIRERGVLVSELPPGTRPKARHFPRRNRIISGVSRGVIVVEAAPRSGSLITARLALEQGREVFAVPGSAMDPRARGTNELIRQGAYLTESVEDVLEVIGIDRNIRLNSLPDLPDQQLEKSPDEPDNQDTDDARQLIENWIGPIPTHMDAVMRQSELPPAALNEALLELELAGRLARHPGNMISILTSP
jgi:DNA processing protein